MRTTRLAPRLCPKCDYMLDAASPAAKGSRAVPKPGDFSVCLKCAAILQFDAALLPQAPEPGALGAALAEQPDLYAELQRVARAILQYHIENSDALSQTKGRA